MHKAFPSSHGEPLCPQASAIYPAQSADLWKTVGSVISSESFKTQAVDWLGGAVRVPTESYDKMPPVGDDPRWEAFGPFHDYLLEAFPLVHASLSLSKVNTYGLIYTWQGSDPSLKPLLLAAHQDVVPVDPKTVGEWEHPPYSGYFDGENLWGRGSSDDKSGLIAIMSTIETFLKNGFKPTRTIVLAFGFDEEASGLHGAAQLGDALLSSYGEDAFAMIIDEGGGFGEQQGSVFATPGIAEKGYLDTRITVSSPGGHSSLPPSHTSIGILSQLLVELESKPFEVHLQRGTPLYGTIQCVGAHAKNIPANLRKAIKKSVKSEKYLRKLEDILFESPSYKSLAGTTQAIDLIQGGVKANALPEEAWAVVNHRIATQSSIEATQDRDTALSKALAEKFNLTFTAFGTSVSSPDAPAYGTLTLEDAWGTALKPAPITPTDADAVPFRILSGTIRATYDAHRDLKGGDNIFVSPGIMSGNTDTRYYWQLSEHIFRYNHHNSGTGTALSNGVHTVNEHIRIVDFLEMIRFFSTLILNVDESRDF
ncbi:carboxypeptidase S [Amylostereum chailletii]|nr:carboxypeptidase S [Amylostereum chailletii]